MANEGGGWGSMFGAVYAATKTILRAPVALVGWAYDQFRQPVAHGSSEVANALFNGGNGFVLYGSGVQEAPNVAPVVKSPEPVLQLPEPVTPPKIEAPQVKKGMRM